MVETQGKMWMKWWVNKELINHAKDLFRPFLHRYICIPSTAYFLDHLLIMPPHV